MNYRSVKNLLSSVTEENEATAITFLLFEKLAGMDKMKVLMGDEIPKETENLIMEAANRVAQGEPVQYVIGETDFYGLTFNIAKGALIPRPETEELVEWGISSLNGEKAVTGKILDIGTGSGCIAISVAKNTEATVEAWDISDDALSIATDNAKKNGVNVAFRKVDVLNFMPTDKDRGEYCCIFSNPPYICNSESEDMENNVLDYEPHIALFVPDSDPLLFYRKIAEIGKELLMNDGMLFFEINRRFGKETVDMLTHLGYSDIELRQDQFGNDRMVKAINR
ncbi:MAG: peptide chain release factor N(5)-glutamine methyltransferase [Bacteroidaceae bacterium]|nr:peptide chain release factor N(5)-glutamine methyltransferase [Bacteroidaceae bacterium]